MCCNLLHLFEKENDNTCKLHEYWAKVGERVESLRGAAKIKISELTGKDTKDGLLNMTEKTYYSNRSGTTPYKLETILRLAQTFKVSTDYLLLLDDDMNKGNTFIHETLGLSEKSIEVLRYMQVNRQTGEYAFNAQAIQMLNHILESSYDFMFEKRSKGENATIPTLLNELYQYINTDGITCTLDETYVLDDNGFRLKKAEDTAGHSFVREYIPVSFGNGDLDFLDLMPMYKEVQITRIRSAMDSLSKTLMIKAVPHLQK